ncbi:MAG: helix-turn-helix domain-containing protein [Clostridiales bacterium]|nr:helix-turn-helix domain-containing protein [Clostridiales bacterium]
MDADKTMELIQNSFPASKLREMLGISKTESYWLIKKKCFETVTVLGRIRIMQKSFDNWYDNQTHYIQTNGKPPGIKLREGSYTVREIANLLSISDMTVYDRIRKNMLKTFKADLTLRVTKESFDTWYAGQDKFRISENRDSDAKPIEKCISPAVKLAGPQTSCPMDERKNECETAEDQQSEEMANVASDTAEKEYYEVSELVGRLGIDKKRIYRLINSGAIQVVKTRKGYLIHASEVFLLQNGGED